MLKHSLFFWIVIAISIAAGFYGLAAGEFVVFVPYALLNPLILLFITSLPAFKAVRERIEVLGGIIILLNIPGSLYLHHIDIQYDIFLHFASWFAAGRAIYLMLPLIIKNIKAPRTMAFITSVAIGVGAEGIQKLSDLLLGTKLFFDISQPILIDFQIDILMNAVGALLGILLIKKAKQAF